MASVVGRASFGADICEILARKSLNELTVRPETVLLLAHRGDLLVLEIDATIKLRLLLLKPGGLTVLRQRNHQPGHDDRAEDDEKQTLKKFVDQVVHCLIEVNARIKSQTAIRCQEYA